MFYFHHARRKNVVPNTCGNCLFRTRLLDRTPLRVVRSTAVACGKVPLSALVRKITIVA